jgi:hypothetical protein
MTLNYSFGLSLGLLLLLLVLLPSLLLSGEPHCYAVRKHESSVSQSAFEWICVYRHDEIIQLAQSDNIKNCFSCFLKKFSEWTWEQEIRKGIREDPKYITCRRYKRKKAKNGQQVCLYRGANNTYTLVVEGQCPQEFQCKYDPNGKEPNIDSVVESLNESFKK